ncbi:MAG: HEAT repeat domain-containing protein, partial [Planctomycetia bacterium]
ADPVVRSEVLSALGRIGAPAVAALSLAVGELADPDPNVRPAACFLLGRLGPAARDAAPALKTAAAAAETDFLRTACHWALLRVAGDDDANVKVGLPHLVAGLATDNPAVLQELVDLLGDLGPRAAAAAPALIALVQKSEVEPLVRAAGIYALSTIAKPDATVRAALQTALKDHDPSVRVAAAVAVARLFPKDVDALPALVDLLAVELQSNDPVARLQAAEGLAFLSPLTTAAMKVFGSALHSRDADLRGLVLATLADSGPGASLVVKDLIAAVDDSAPGNRLLAIRVLGGLSDLALEAVPALTTATKSNDPATRYTAAVALVQVKHDEALAASLAPEFRKLLESKSRSVQLDAAEALAGLRIADEPAIELLRQEIAAGAPMSRRRALFALASLGPKASKAVDDLARLLEKNDPALLPAVCYVAGRIGPAADKLEPALVKIHATAELPLLKTIAAWALLRVSADDPKIVERVGEDAVAGLDSPRPPVRLEVAEVVAEAAPVLAKVKPAVASQAAKRLAEMAAGDPSPRVKTAAADALKKLEAVGVKP